MSLWKLLKLMALISFVYILLTTFAFYKLRIIPESEWKVSYQPYPSDKPENIFWLVQVSDLHISKFYDPLRVPDFKKFCSKTLDLIDPEIVLVTGDLTDAKHKNLYNSEQFLEEWESYNKILMETNVLDKYVWLDVRGNHDAFDVISLNSSSNLYSKLSGSKGTLTNKSFHFVKSFGKYSFIPVNAALDPGPKRPFNFFGHMSKLSMDALNTEGQKSLSSNLTIWYGHYPTPSVSTSASIGLRNLLGKFGAIYLCGHFHDLGGLFPRLQTMHSSGFLELELKDWKVNRFYRVVAVDHDLISFVDVKFGEWPVILITNPKPATYMIPKHEPIGRINNSTHIRFLVFSSSDVRKAVVRIDGEMLGFGRQISTKLWVCVWNPAKYRNGEHNLTITIQDSNGNIKSETSIFCLNNNWNLTFNIYSILILMTDFCTLGQVIFSILLLSSILLLIYLKLFAIRISSKKYFFQNFLFGLQILVTDDLTFYTLILFLSNLGLGPIFVGEVISGHIGVCFVYGIYINGKFVEEKLLFIHIILLMIGQYFPLIVYLAYCAEKRWINDLKFKDSFKKGKTFIACHFGLVFIYILNFRSCLDVYLSYGMMALLISPSKLWWSLISIWLPIRVWNVSNYKLKNTK